MIARTTLALAIATFSASASAISLLEYAVVAATANATMPASVVNSNVTATVVTPGAGITANAGATWNFAGWNGTSFADAVSKGDTWTFSMTANADIDLTTLDIRLDRSNTGPGDFEIRASVNGGAPVTLLSGTALNTAGADFLNVDISALSLTSGDTVAFTLAAFNASNVTAGTFDLETINFSSGGTYGLRINGDLATTAPAPTQVPVPAAALALLGLSLAGIARRKAA